MYILENIRIFVQIFRFYTSTSPYKPLITMKTQVYTAFFTGLTAFSCATYSFAQDVHFSQYDQTVALTRPALVGGYTDNTYQRAAVAYRNQWQTVPVAYNSVLGSWDREIRLKKTKNSHFGVGFS